MSVRLSARADGVQIGKDRRIGAKDQMIAIVDQAAERLVVKRAAASAGLSGGFMKRDRAARAGDFNRTGEPRHAGADDVDHRHGRAVAIVGGRMKVAMARQLLRPIVSPFYMA